jgi:trimethyllysine dioxygenase
METAPPRIHHVACDADGLIVQFVGASQPERYGWMWLRDHDENERSLDPSTMQRRVDTFSLVDDVRGIDAAVSADDGLIVRWSDGSPDGYFSVRTLAEVAGLWQPLAEPQPWSLATAPDPLPIVDAAAVMGSDAGVRQWLNNVQVHGFGLVRGLEPTTAAAEALARRVAYPRQTIFGGMWTLSSEVRAHDDSAYSTSFLEPHTDGTYAVDAPGLQMFCCLEREGSGGESLLVDGLDIANSIRRDDPDAFRVLSTVSVTGRYIESGVHLRATRPPIRLDERGQVAQVSFNNYDRAPMRLPDTEMAEFYRAYRVLHERVNDRSQWLQIRLEPGDAVIFDNWRVLHGRMSYVGRRIFEGCYHNHEDFVSRLLTLSR